MRIGQKMRSMSTSQEGALDIILATFPHLYLLSGRILVVIRRNPPSHPPLCHPGMHPCVDRMMAGPLVMVVAWFRYNQH